MKVEYRRLVRTGIRALLELILALYRSHYFSLMALCKFPEYAFSRLPCLMSIEEDIRRKPLKKQVEDRSHIAILLILRQFLQLH